MQSLSLRNGQQKPSLSSRVWDACKLVVLKLLLPAAPIIALVIISSNLINADITGEYKGSSPITGSVNLVLNDEKDHLSGELILKDRIHLHITDGRMIDESKIELLFKLPRRGINSTIADPSFIGNRKQNTIEGVFYNGSSGIQLKLHRGSTSAFFNRRWFSRLIDYCAGKSN